MLPFLHGLATTPAAPAAPVVPDSSSPHQEQGVEYTIFQIRANRQRSQPLTVNLCPLHLSLEVLSLWIEEVPSYYLRTSHTCCDSLKAFSFQFFLYALDMAEIGT